MVPDGEMEILRTYRSMVREMCGVQFRERKIYMDLMFMFGLSKA